MENICAFHLTEQGATHIKHNKARQDDGQSYYDGQIAFAVVCDGHGGDDYIRSDTGSRLAAAVAGECIGDFVGKILHKYDIKHLQRHSEEILRSLAAAIIAEWRKRITEDWLKKPFTEDELANISDKARQRYGDDDIASAYGTTLIAVAFTDEYWFGLKIGDGKCVSVSKEGKFETPIPDDGICFLNSTTSICDRNAIENFRYIFSTEKPAAVFIGTDGIDDCFCKDEQLFNFYKTILFSFAHAEFEAAKADLKDYLPRLSAKGSGDDVSVGAIMDFSLIRSLGMAVSYNARLIADKQDISVKEIDGTEAFGEREDLASGHKFMGVDASSDEVYLSKSEMQIRPNESLAIEEYKKQMMLAQYSEPAEIPIKDCDEW